MSTTSKDPWREFKDKQAAYWREREDKQEAKNRARTEAEEAKKLDQIYKEQYKSIEKEINAFYSKYATDNGLDIATVKKQASQLDIKLYEQKAQQYIATHDVSDKANQEMALFNLTMKTSRLELLKADIALELARGGTAAEKQVAQSLHQQAYATYQKQAGKMADVLPDVKKSADAIVNASFHSAKWSDRIWTHQQALRNQLNKVLSEGVIQGKSAKEFIKAVKDKHGVTAYQAERLLVTEMNRVRNQMALKTMSDEGVTQFIYIIGSVGKVCGECESMEGQVFDIKDAAVGDNVPPLHPNCRCSVGPYVDQNAYERYLDSDTDLFFDEYQEYGELAENVLGKETEMSKAAADSKSAADEMSKIQADYDKAVKNIGRCKNGSPTYQKYEHIIADYETNKRLKASSEQRAADLSKELAPLKTDLLDKRISHYELKSKPYEPDKPFYNLWKNPITLKEYVDLDPQRLQNKRSYFENQLSAAQAANDTASVKKFQSLISDMNLLDKRAEGYGWVNDVLKDLETAKRALTFDDKYSQARKDAAYRFTSANGGTAGADKILRPLTGQVWQSSSAAQRKAIYDYTRTYHCINEPLRGIEYGTSVFKGVGNINFDTIGVVGYYSQYKVGEVRQKIRDMTDIIDKCEYKHDMWFTRGCHYSGMDKFFNCDQDLLQNGTTAELTAVLQGKEVIEFGFMSTGVSKGTGFDGEIKLNVYAPAGSKYIWAEPFSAYGNGAQSYRWDGKSGQGSYGGEAEAIFQRGSKFRISKIYRDKGTVYVDLDLISQKEGPAV